LGVDVGVHRPLARRMGLDVLVVPVLARADEVHHLAADVFAGLAAERAVQPVAGGLVVLLARHDVHLAVGVLVAGDAADAAEARPLAFLAAVLLVVPLVVDGIFFPRPAVGVGLAPAGQGEVVVRLRQPALLVLDQLAALLRRLLVLAVLLERLLPVGGAEVEA